MPIPAGGTGVELDLPEVWTMLDLIRSSIFILCELFVLLLLFSPLLVTTDEKGATAFRPLGARWAVFGVCAAVLVLAAIFVPG
jgi:hypothetical protein